MHRSTLALKLATLIRTDWAPRVPVSGCSNCTLANINCHDRKVALIDNCYKQPKYFTKFCPLLLQSDIGSYSKPTYRNNQTTYASNKVKTTCKLFKLDELELQIVGACNSSVHTQLNKLLELF